MLQRKRRPVGSCLWVLSQGKLLAAAFRAWRSVAWLQANTQALQQVGSHIHWMCCRASFAVALLLGGFELLPLVHGAVWSGCRL
jgi:hypothetical protein